VKRVLDVTPREVIASEVEKSGTGFLKERDWRNGEPEGDKKSGSGF
jgi:hypothetical protein